MRLVPSNNSKRWIIDDLAVKILRRPSAAPTFTPAELIAVTLTTTQWKPDRYLEADDLVVQSIIDMLKEGGYSIVPTESKKEQ